MNRPDRHLDDRSFVPLLTPPNWAGRETFACRPLVDDPAAPLVAFGWVGGDRPQLLRRDEALLRGWSTDDLDEAARKNLERRPGPLWRALWLGILPALSCEGDELTAAVVLDRRAMSDLHRRLGCPRVAIGLPHRGGAVACGAESVDVADLPGFVQLGFDAARVAGRGPVCPFLLVVEDGEVREVVVPHRAGARGEDSGSDSETSAGVSSSDTEAPRQPERRLSPSLTRKGALVLRTTCADEETLVAALGRELPGITKGVEKKGGFRGVVKLKLDPDAFPPTRDRRVRFAALEQMVRELAASKGLRAPGGKRVLVKVSLEGEASAPIAMPLRRARSSVLRATVSRSGRARRFR